MKISHRKLLLVSLRARLVTGSDRYGSGLHIRQALWLDINYDWPTRASDTTCLLRRQEKCSILKTWRVLCDDLSCINAPFRELEYRAQSSWTFVNFASCRKFDSLVKNNARWTLFLVFRDIRFFQMHSFDVVHLNEMQPRYGSPLTRASLYGSQSKC